VARFLSGYGAGLEDNPARLTELEDRQEELHGLVRKHGTDLDGVLVRRAELQGEIETLSRYEEAIDRAEALLAECQGTAGQLALKLSQDRTRAARKLARAVNAELADLGFGQARFTVAVERLSREPGTRGFDQVEFTVALNPGEGAHPLRRVASGGELSRLMLAVKRALTGVGPVGTYIFDEVDAGIGGEVASAVGRKLREVSENHQVICITHLPQIAGMADHHLLVSKSARGKRTTTTIRPLDEKERVDELARMVGGERVTVKTRAAAAELLSQTGSRR
jgi:DNA repair protein RecN (Recombination protein N)